MKYDCLIIDDEIELANNTCEYLNLYEVKTFACHSKKDCEEFFKENRHELYEENWYSGMRKKLGLFNKEEEDKDLIDFLLNIMEKYKADYTNTFSNLTLENTQKMAMFSSDEFKKWNELWEERLKRQNENKKESIKLMKKNNPRVIPRNERVEEALEYAEKGDYTLLKKLLYILSNPYDYSLNENNYIEVSNDKGCKYKTYCGT